MSQEVKFTVPLVPPSVNHYKMRTNRGVTFVGKEAKAFKQAVAIFSRGQQLEAEAYEVSAVFYLGHGQRGDLDNLLKCTLDGLAESRVIRTDAAVMRLTAEKSRDKENPRTEITVKEF